MRNTIIATLLALTISTQTFAESTRPNIVLVMADDMGYGQTGYYNHPLLKTPHLDTLAKNGLRLDQFYAAGPVCSPTRASVMTGRTHERTGVMTHGYALRHQEKTIAAALQANGYATGHFGKWHLNGHKGPGVPILADDRFSPGRFGFEKWLSVSNFFDRDPLLSRQGKFEAFTGDSSEVVIDEMLAFAKDQVQREQPFFAVVWYGTPHSPFRASEADIKSLRGESGEHNALVDSLDKNSLNHYGELVAMDRSLGTLHKGLDSIDALKNTLIWFCSDNGGLPGIRPATTGPLRGNKGTLYEGGLRVPCVLHWPARIVAGRVSQTPACATDIAPTILDLLNLPDSMLVAPVDGISLVGVIEGQAETPRPRPLGFRYQRGSAVVDYPWKLLRLSPGKRKRDQPKPATDGVVGVLYNLEQDVAETTNVADQHPAVAARLSQWLDEWNGSVDDSFAGADYPEKKVSADHPEPSFWTDEPAYREHFDQFRDRWQYADWIKQAEAK
jgi:arylsulfatase A-like enzyme